MKEGTAHLKLVKFQAVNSEAGSQQTDPSQFPATQGPQIMIGDNLYKGIRVFVSFSGSAEGAAEGQIISS